jgi:hypothetical protein
VFSRLEMMEGILMLLPVKSGQHRFLPVLFAGLAVGLLVFPPSFLREMGWLRHTLELVFAVLFLVSLYTIVLLNDLPGDLVMVPNPEADMGPFKEDMHRLSEMGFLPAGLPMEMRLVNNLIFLPYFNAEWAAFALVGKTASWPSRTTYEFITFLDSPSSALTSFTEMERDRFPSGPGEFRQLFPTSRIDELFKHHSDAVVYLHNQRIYRREVDPEALVSELRSLCALRRRMFLSAPLKNTFRIMLNQAAKHCDHRGPLAKQGDLQLPRPAEGAEDHFKEYAAATSQG